MVLTAEFVEGHGCFDGGLLRSRVSRASATPASVAAGTQPWRAQHRRRARKFRDSAASDTQNWILDDVGKSGAESLKCN